MRKRIEMAVAAVAAVIALVISGSAAPAEARPIVEPTRSEKLLRAIEMDRARPGYRQRLVPRVGTETEKAPRRAPGSGAGQPSSDWWSSWPSGF